MKPKLHYRRGNAPACGAWGDGLLLTEDRTHGLLVPLAELERLCEAAVCP